MLGQGRRQDQAKAEKERKNFSHKKSFDLLHAKIAP
jgi:hypothetical protein